MIDLIKEMSRDWLGRFLLALTTFTIGLLGLFGFLIWQSMHDGVKCAEQRFSHFQPVIVTVGKITTVNQIPIYECVRSVAAPEELKAAKQVPTVVDR